ncbi:choice-of-anchor L domain-containing protein [Flavobacteriaceae bacterium]|nr:choice-of-anchor L domain-containing protein [Flavobacteriaceae bacterium]
MIRKICLLTLLLFKLSFSQDNLPPEIFSEGNEFYCPLSEQAIVTFFDITDPDDESIEALYIQISEGYVQGEDLLILTGFHPGVQESWDPVSGKLELKGPGGAEALYTDLIAAVYDVKFISNNPNPTDKSFSFTIGDTNYLEETGHYYEFISLVDVTWTESKELAENLTYYGLQGYLATITSAEENQIAAVQTNDVGWIGASDAANEGDWRWVTGPEGLENNGDGLPFWNGAGSQQGGVAVNNGNGSEYSNWNGTAEPNNAGPEHYAHVTSPNVGEIGTWNDLPNPASGGGDYQSKGYIVEYGGMPGDPVLNLSSSTNLLAPVVENISGFFGCLNELTELVASSNIGDGDVYWYDSQIGGNLIFEGTNFNPDISETTSFFVSPFAGGECDNFNRIEIGAVINPSPTPVAPDVMVDQCTYTVEELVTEILINNECADISNITYSSGTDFDDVNGIGYFSEISDNFEFSQGIILSSGDASLGTGPNPGIGNESSGDFGWPGDIDLTTLLEQTDSANDNTNNASVIEFDFVPISNNISFRFIMASEEYDQGSFECSFSDIFGFFLTNEDGVTTNLAVLPDSDTPILVTNIHPDNGVCGAANPEYFGGYVAEGESPIAYDGYTRAFTAQSEVVPGQTYHIKLAVADAGDSALDTAVFLEGGSFDLGIDLGDDILIENGLAPCPDDTYTIDTFTENGDYTWFNNDIEIEGENSSVLEVSETGNYSVNISYGETCNYSDDLFVEFYIPLTIESPDTLFSCDNNLVDGFGLFDLSQQTEPISASITTIPTISYFETLEDAEQDINAIANIESYQNITPFNQTVFVRIVENTFPNCYSTTSFGLTTINPPTITIPTPLEECDNDYDGIDIFDLSQKTDELLGGQLNISVSYHESQEDADNAVNAITEPYSNLNSPDSQNIFVRLEDNETFCYATTTLALVVNPIPEVIVPPVIEVCDDDYDGISTFDLVSLDPIILNGQTGITVSYYESQAEADTATNPLASPYNNTSLNTQELIVRLENDITGCYSTTTQGIIVNPLSLIEVIDYEICDYVNPGDMIEVFDIISYIDDYFTAQNVTETYHGSLADAESGNDPYTTAELTNYSNSDSASEEIFVRLVDNVTACVTTGSFNIVVNPLPNVIVNTDLVQCDIDDVQDGISIYNLEEAAENIVIPNGPGDSSDNYVLTFHLSQEDLDAGMNAIPNPTSYVNLTPLQNIYCRVENIATGCYTTSFFYLETIFNPIPEDAGLIVCDNSEGNGNDYDGLGLFTLSNANDYVLSLIVANPNNDITSPDQLTIAYYASEEDALLELNQLPNQYTSEVPDAQTVYLRVERDNDCFGINSMLLQVLPVPVYNEVLDEILCTYTPGTIDVDLNDYNAQVLGGQNAGQVIITYHNSQLDADTGFNALASPYTINDEETIYVRVEVEDGDPFVTACFISNINFTLTVAPRPVFIAPEDLIVCDDDDTIDGLTTIDISVQTETIAAGIAENVVTYHISQEDADSGENPLEDLYTTITPDTQTIFARIEDDMTPITACYSTTPMDLVVVGPPAATTPSNLEFCDADADGFGVFTLTDADAEITGTLSNLAISYHETFSDAENNLFPIIGDYNNIVQYQQTIYVRVEDTTISTDCFTYLELLLVVNDVPQIETEPSALEVCDNDTDGFGLFDLSLANEEILNGLDPLEFEITYYETSENATLGENPIATPLAYTNVSPFTQDIYVRVENIATECYNTTALTLIVNELPVLIQPDPLELCDDNNTGDEVEEFTLEDSLAQVLNGQTGISVTFHETQEDADNGDAPIFSPYTNIVNAQTIYLRAENDITGCVSTITLDLRVNPLPSPVTVEPLEACDVDADGFTSFDLESVSEDIINGELDIFITYYETLTDAENALNPLASPYDNIVPNQQTLFVRAENSITGCFSIIDLELISLPSPQLPIVIDDIIICDDDLNGFFQFDLTQNTALILGDQVASEFNLSYHISQEDADTGDNPIVNPETYSNLSNPQTIYVRLESIENLCVSTGEFDLIVSLPPDAIQPLPLEICDDIIADETTVFDLTVKDEEITGGNPWIVEYFETEEDAMANTNVIADPEAYTNTVVGTNALNPQTLFVRVTDPSTTCYSFVTLTIRVLPNPTPSIDPANIELCDYDASGDELEIFDITINEAYIINGEEGVSVTYYETQEDAELGENAIVDPAVYTNITLGQQTIYVRVTNDITACYTIVTFDLVVNPLPDVSAADQYIACEIDTDGFFDFDLDTVSASILGTQDPLNFTVTYHETQEDADNGENVLVSPYTNLTNPQQLFVNITNNTTGCFIAVPSITIEVQEAAQANSDLDRIEYIICDNLADNDGFGTFNLSSQNEEILDGQDPANFTVTYYDNQIDAELGTNPLANSYENTSNPQVIYARVDNDTTADAQCYATTNLTLIVNLLPEFFLEDVYLGCVNVNGSELLDPVVMDIGLDPALYSFEWFDPTGTLVSTNVTYTPLVGGTFTAIATNLATGCQNTVTTLVDPSSPPEVSAVVTTEFFADIHVIEASATGEGIYEFSLDDGPWQTSGTFEDVTPGFHTVVARDVNGCGTGTTQVLVIDYPHFFTPNGDGYNDTWRVEGIETRPLAKIYIYDRYGKLLKQLSPLGPGWDGTFNGENLPASDYWFTIRLDVIYGDDESLIKEFTGHFSLKR